MSNNKNDYVPVPSERLLSIDPAPFGFGYALIEYEPLRLVDWGTRECRRDDGSALGAVKQLLLDYQPTALVLPDWREPGHPMRGPAIEAFIESVGEVLNSETLEVLIASLQDIRDHFGDGTKQEVAEGLADQFPELHAVLPLPRKNSDRERQAMSVFDALAMSLATRRVEAGEQ
jgi:hypothetical protein